MNCFIRPGRISKIRAAAGIITLLIHLMCIVEPAYAGSREEALKRTIRKAKNTQILVIDLKTTDGINSDLLHNLFSELPNGPLGEIAGELKEITIKGTLYETQLFVGRSLSINPMSFPKLQRLDITKLPSLPAIPTFIQGAPLIALALPEQLRRPEDKTKYTPEFMKYLLSIKDTNLDKVVIEAILAQLGQEGQTGSGAHAEHIAAQLNLIAKLTSGFNLWQTYCLKANQLKKVSEDALPELIAIKRAREASRQLASFPSLVNDNINFHESRIKELKYLITESSSAMSQLNELKKNIEQIKFFHADSDDIPVKYFESTLGSESAATAASSPITINSQPKRLDAATKANIDSLETQLNLGQQVRKIMLKLTSFPALHSD